MGKRGPKPEPTRLKLLKGNPGRQPLNEMEPQPDPTMPECPPQLTDDAKACWENVVPELHRMGLATKLDRTLLAVFCQAEAHWLESLETIKKYGRLVEGRAGGIVQNPAVHQFNKCGEILAKIGAEFGFSASSRTGLVSHPMGKAQEDREAKYCA